MRNKKIYLISPHAEKGWKVILEKGEKSLRNFDTKKEALGWATTIAKENKPSQIKVKRANGTYDKEFVYD